jgi:hypothetical protein
MTSKAAKGVEATPLMDPEVVSKLVWDAKYLFEHGAFGPLQQAEFFRALAAEVAAPPPPPAPAPEGMYTDSPDLFEATASVGDTP